MKRWILHLLAMSSTSVALSAGILTTDQSDIRIFSANASGQNPMLTKVDDAKVSLAFNMDMATVTGSIDMGTIGRINIESAPLPDGGDTEDPFTIDAFYQQLGGVPNPAPLHPNAKVVLLFVDPKTVVGSFTAGKKQEFTGSFVLKLK